MTNKDNIPNNDQLSQLVARLLDLEAKVALLDKENKSLATDNLRLEKEIVATKRECQAQVVHLKNECDTEVAHWKNECDVQVTHWKNECDKLIEQVKLANMRYFGSKSERVIALQISLFNEMEASSTDKAQEPLLDEVLIPRPRRRGGKRKIDLTKYETVVIEHTLPKDKQVCPACSAYLDDFKCEVTSVVKLIPAHLIVEQHRRHVYICKDCSAKNAKDGSVDAQFMRSDMPKFPIEKSFASASLIAYILNGKYVNALPLYRMEQDFRCLGIKISRQNMANWVLKTYDLWFSLIHSRMKEKLLEQNLIHADETPVQVLKEPNRLPKQKSFMWLFCSGKHDIPNFIFEYHQTRSAQVAKDFFSNWSGTITTDGYSPYFKLGENISNTACLVHVRRKFAEIVKVAGGDIKAASVASVALCARQMIDEMFRIDDAFDDMSVDERKDARIARLLPVMQEFERWAKIQIGLALPKMALHKALSYALKYWTYVKNVVSDGRFELSNNIAERAIRPFAIGRKNFLFSDTPKGAHASAAIYSIVTTAKLNGLNPRPYLEWLLEVMPNTKNLGDKDVIDQFMPWSEHVPDSCRLSPKAASVAAKMADDPIIDIDPEAFSSEVLENS